MLCVIEYFAVTQHHWSWYHLKAWVHFLIRHYAMAAAGKRALNRIFSVSKKNLTATISMT